MILRLVLIYILYLIGPNDSITFISILFLLLIINHYKQKVKTVGLFRADILFMISFVLIHFLVPFLVNTFDYNYRYDYKNQLVLLSQYSFLSMLVFSFSYAVTKNKRPKLNLINYKNLNTYLSLIDKFLLALLIIFYVSAGRDYLTAEIYNNSSSTDTLFGISAYVFTIIVIIFLLRFAATATNINLINSKKTKLFRLITLIFLITLFLAGDRSTLIVILLAIVTLVQLSKFKLNNFKLTVFSIFTLFILSITRIYRADTLVYKSFSDSIISSLVNIADSFRVFYFSFSIVEIEGIQYGQAMLGPIAGIVPFLQGVLVKNGILFENTLNSSNIFTIYRHGSLNISGEGSTILADLYLNFGFIGCLIGMIVLGYIFKKSTSFNFYKNSIIQNFYALVFVCFSIYLARATFFYPIKFLVWGYLLHRFFVFLAYRLKS